METLIEEKTEVEKDKVSRIFLYLSHVMRLLNIFEPLIILHGIIDSLGFFEFGVCDKFLNWKFVFKTELLILKNE